MKKVLLAILVSVLTLLVVGQAFALSATTLSVGGNRQVASNSQARLSSDQNVFVTGSFTLTNDGNETLTNLRLASVAAKLGLSTTDLSINSTFTATTLAPNASTSVTITARVPEKLDAVDSSTYAEKIQNVADLVIQGTTPGSQTAQMSVPLNMERRNYLEITSVNICVADRCKSVSDRGTVDNIKPGDTIDLTVKVKNRYSTVEREDLDIRDTVVEYSIDDSDFSQNDNVDVNDLSADDTKEESFSFTVDDTVRDGTFKMLVKVYGRDENGALMGEQNEISLRVERKSHDLTIRRVQASPTTLDCGTGRQLKVTTTYSNVGKRDETKVALEAINSELKFDEKLTGLSLAQDDSRSDTINVKIPDTAKPGVYKVVARTYFDDTLQSDENTVDVIVPNCEAASSTTTDTSSQTTTTQSDAEKAALASRIAELEARLAAQNSNPATSTQPSTRSRTTTSVADTSVFTSSGMYVALLALVVLIVVVLIIVMIVKFSRPRAE